MPAHEGGAARTVGPAYANLQWKETAGGVERPRVRKRNLHPQISKSCGGRHPQCVRIIVRTPGRAHCLQRAPNSSTVVDRCLGAQSTCGEIAGPLTRGAPFRRRGKLIAIGKLLAVEGSQDKVNFVRASRRLQEVVCTLFFAARSYPIGGRAIATSRANANSIVGRHFRPNHTECRAIAAHRCLIWIVR
jgi:hypothetical protein